jgi:serine/threonine protein phosphatase PrpC
MGTTVAGLAVQGDEAIIFNIGDSRVYRREGDFLQLLTVDDRLSGEREFGEAKEAAATNVLLQCLGAQRTSESPIAHFNTLPLGALETFLVCTDGVSDVVSLDDIEACMRNPSRRCVEDLAAAVLAAGAPDNFSIIEVRIIDGATLACTGKT